MNTRISVKNQRRNPGELRRFRVSIPRVGYAEGYVTDAQHAELLGIEVREKLRRRGFGSTILARFAQEAKASGATQLGAAFNARGAKRLADRLFGRPLRQSTIEDWEPTDGFQPVEADYTLTKPLCS